MSMYDIYYLATNILITISVYSLGAALISSSIMNIQDYWYKKKTKRIKKSIKYNIIITILGFIGTLSMIFVSVKNIVTYISNIL